MIPLPPCGETARRHDPDRFLISMLMPPAVRPHLWALYAFNHEVARTRAVVTDTTLGLIRLQWWRDQIAAIYEGGVVERNPILSALSLSVEAHALPRAHFDTLLYAREFDLEDRAPFDLSGMAHYADFTSTPLLALSCQVAGASAPESLIRDVGVAYALMRLLRQVPEHLRQRRCYLPASLTPPVHRLYDGFELDGLLPAAQAVSAETYQRLQAVRDTAPRILRLHTALTHIYLNRIKRLKYNLFSPYLQVPPLGCALRLWWRTILH